MLKQDKKSALILEGGANRGIFTAGALDYLMKQEFWTDYVIGVSAGACNAVDYVSKQPLRSKECIIAWNQETKRQRIENFHKEHSFLDMKMLFDTFPNQDFPFDFGTYFSSDIQCELAVTNALTGKAEYLSEKEDGKRLMNLCQASCSLPILSKSVKIDGIPYFDGGVADSIPVLHAKKLGYDKIFIILTQPEEYRKKTSKKTIAIMKARYPQYPDLTYALSLRAKRYNRCLDHIKKWEKAGKLFVIRPEMQPVSRLERHEDKLEAFYQHGYDVMEKQYPSLMEYMN